jgi:hypothetical protein
MIDLTKPSQISITTLLMVSLTFFLRLKRFSCDKNLHFKDLGYEFADVL